MRGKGELGDLMATRREAERGRIEGRRDYKKVEKPALMGHLLQRADYPSKWDISLLQLAQVSLQCCCHI